MKFRSFFSSCHSVLLCAALPSLSHAGISSVNESGLGGDAAAIVETSFGEDALTFSDRTHQHNGVAFTAGGTLSTTGTEIAPLPSYLLGNPYVRFANNARDQGGYSAVVTADESSDFYLLVDNRVNGPAGNTSSPNTSDPDLGGGLQWILDGGWERVDTGISPNGQADYTGVDESGDGNGPGVGLNQFYSVYKLPNPSTSASVSNNGAGGSNMIALVVAPAGGGGGGDGDGMPDAWEMANFGNLDQTDGGDFDSDGLTNLQEFNLGSDPDDVDTDNDGLNDGPEVNLYNTNPADNDSDNDGRTDGDEINGSPVTDPNDSDSDNDGLSDGAEIATHMTNPTLPDSDGDGFSDGAEIANNTDPNDINEFPDFGDLGDVLINEFMAANNSTNTGGPSLVDEDGDSSDWIELWNPTVGPVDISGWWLTDDPLDLTKWQFPAHVMANNEFLLIFASGKDRDPAGGEWHTDFKLDKASGEYLALTRPDGKGGVEVVSSFFDLPSQVDDVSYGFHGSMTPLSIGFFQAPTPGAANDSTAVQGFVDDTSFSVDRGYYDAPFLVTITTTTPDATIAYTTDGSLPSAGNGTQVAGSTANVSIATTTTLRAIGMKTGFVSTNVDTHTYIFAADSLEQDGSGIPNSSWGHAGPDWEMDPVILNHPDPDCRPVADDFKRIPTISLVLPFNDMWGNGGIYPSGESVEKSTSIEYLNPDGSVSDPNTRKGFQVEGTVQIVGGSSTGRWKSDKLSMRLKFDQDLRYPVFGDEATDRFDTLVLDERLNNVWHYGGGSGAVGQRSRAQYSRDQFPGDIQNALGGYAPHGRHIQLFINGIYWGISELHERPDDNFAEQYLGGDNADYDVMKHRISTVVAGSNANYNSLHSIAGQNLATQANYDAVADILDIDDFIKYMLTNFYVGNTDWAHQNWYASYNKVDPDGKWRFHNWDPEHCLESKTTDVTNKDNAGGPTAIHQNLRDNLEYRTRFGDIAHKAMVQPDGILTPENAAALYRKRTDPIDLVTRLESARWGDNRTGAGEPSEYTRKHWLTNRDQLLGLITSGTLGNYFPERTGIVLDQLRNRNIYPDLEAPVFNQHGGFVPGGFGVIMTTGSPGTIWYTTDGSDPRLPGGAVSPTAEIFNSGVSSTNVIANGNDAAPGVWSYLDTGTDLGASNVVLGNGAYNSSHWKHPDFDDSSWASGPSQLGYAEGDENTLLGWGPDPTDRFATTYFRKELQLSDFGVASLGDIVGLDAGVVRDDGVIVYFNGVEVYRSNMDSGTVESADFAASSVSGASEDNFNSFTIPVNLLLPGTNVIAAEIHQASGTSSDISFDFELDADVVTAGSSLTLDSDASVQARVLNGSEWSAISCAEFLVDTVQADSTNLVLSEIHYRPAPPSQNEINAGFLNRGDFEFAEFYNSGSSSIDLSQVSFSAGLDFHFATDASIRQLAPGARLVIVSDHSAFEMRYGSGLPVAGEFQTGTNLSNGGELLEVDNLALAEEAQTILSLTYSDSAPWPSSADGAGYSLTLLCEAENPDGNLPESWRGSVDIGGSPGTADGEGLASWLAGFGLSSGLDDDDGDGLINLVEYALGTSPLVPGAPLHTGVQVTSAVAGNMSSDGYLVFSFTRSKAATEVAISAETSFDMTSWTENTILADSPVDLGNGLELIQVRVPNPLDQEATQFLRLRIEQK